MAAEMLREGQDTSSGRRQLWGPAALVPPTRLSRSLSALHGTSVSPPPKHRLKPSAPRDRIWRWGRGEMTRPWGQNPQEETGALIRRGERELAPCVMRGHGEKAATCTPGRGPSPESHCAGTLTSSFTSRTVRGERVLLKGC